MEESRSLTVDADMATLRLHEQVKVPRGRNPVIRPNSDIDGLLECPMCQNSMYPPIQQCPSGHTLCFECKSKVNNKCPSCRKEMGHIRCLALETLAVSLQLPCKYHPLGCEEMFPYYSKLKHEAQCFFRPYCCPHPGSDCLVTGDIETLLLHLRVHHKVDLQTGCTFNHRYVKQDPCSVDNVSWTLTIEGDRVAQTASIRATACVSGLAPISIMDLSLFVGDGVNLVAGCPLCVIETDLLVLGTRLFNCFGHYFCLHFEAFRMGTGPIYMAFLRFMGEESEAKKFAYCLEVGGDGRKLTWQGVPRSIRVHHHIVRDSYDGLIVPRSLALYFSGGDGKELRLRVTGRIWKEL